MKKIMIYKTQFKLIIDKKYNLISNNNHIIIYHNSKLISLNLLTDWLYKGRPIKEIMNILGNTIAK